MLTHSWIYGIRAITTKRFSLHHLKSHSTGSDPCNVQLLQNGRVKLTFPASFIIALILNSKPWAFMICPIRLSTKLGHVNTVLISLDTLLILCLNLTAVMFDKVSLCIASSARIYVGFRAVFTSPNTLPFRIFGDLVP